ncbi:DUF58 domain-containing protein [Arcticibacter sp. MXS-1]|uniref:DUF58 domain-containing protein n=1 Tax=Arcticibacter sp. MXS-1 TaxID=3341726 RepID=UPI0035A959B9
METKELLAKVRKIEIKTRGLSTNLLSGEYQSAFKGRGMAFSEVREYELGDEIRTIDWNVTARFNHPFVKVFNEERELSVMLLIDVSASGNFGTVNQLKQELATELCAVLAFSAIQNNDKVGVIFFSDKIEKFIPPKKGRSHILMIIRELLAFKPVHKGTDVSQALSYLTSVIRKRCTAFVISDFISGPFEAALKIANKKHDVVALKLYDRHEEEFPDLGLIPVEDSESGQLYWINTSDKSVRNSYKAEAKRRSEEAGSQFRRSGVDFTSIGTHEPYVKPLISLFKKRGIRR